MVCLALLPHSLRAQPAPSPAPSAQTSVQVIAKRVDDYYNSLHSLRANFTETYDGMGIHREESGTLLLRKPGKMRWSYSQPAGKLFLLDGKYAWFYSPGDAQVQRLSASQLDDLRSPLRFLLGHTRIGKELGELKLSTTSGGFRLSGIPLGMQKRIAGITLDVAADGAIHAMTIMETDGARTAFTFAGDQPNAPTTNKDFVFVPPAGVPVVDGLPPV